MSIIFEKECNASFDFDEEELSKSVVDAALDLMDFPYEAQVSITVTDDEGIHEINKEFRNIDNPTDVLSFPQIEFEKIGDYGIINDCDCYTDFDTGEVMLGDIVLNVNRIKSQAKEFGHSEKREYAFLIAHSMLHLFGYDHMNPEEETVMFGKQEELLNALGIKRS